MSKVEIAARLKRRIYRVELLNLLMWPFIAFMTTVSMFGIVLMGLGDHHLVVGFSLLVAVIFLSLAFAMDWWIDVEVKKLDQELKRLEAEQEK